MIETLILETLYLILIAGPSLYIFFKVQDLHRFSGYKGLYYFSRAFLFLAAGFVFRFVIMITKYIQGDLSTIKTFDIMTFLMEWFLIMVGLLLLYTLVWKHFEKKHVAYNWRGFPITVASIAALIALADILTQNFYFMYISQIIVFGTASVISLSKYLKKKNNFLQLYFISMILFLIVWIFNFIAQYTIDDFPIMRLYAYLLTVSACLVIMYVVNQLTRRQ